MRFAVSSEEKFLNSVTNMKITAFQISIQIFFIKAFGILSTHLYIIFEINLTVMGVFFSKLQKYFKIKILRLICSRLTFVLENKTIYHAFWQIELEKYKAFISESGDP